MALSSSNSAELTAEQVQAVLVKPLEAKSVFLAAGPQIVDTAGPLVLPKGGAPTTPAWYGQNEQISEDDPDFDEITLLPTTMKSVKVLTRFSNELARQSVIALDAALKARLVKDVADVVDAQLLSASDGASGTLPRGLFNYATQGPSAVGALGYDDLMDAEALAMGGNVNVDALKWVMTSREFTALRKIKAGTGSNQYAVQPDLTRGIGYTLLGHPVVITNRVQDTDGTPDTGNLALVDFSQIVVARDLAPSVKILDQTFGDFDQQAIRVVARYDAAPLNDDAVIKITGITI
jgi:HK97 family phage major capsid protein